MDRHGSSLTRRAVLAGGAIATTAVLAGCYRRENVELTFESTDERQLHNTASIPTSVRKQERLVEEAIEQGSATAIDTRSPVQTGWPNKHDSSYYELQAERSALGERTAVEFIIRPPDSDIDGETVLLSSLPEIDRTLLDGEFPQPGTDRPVTVVGDFDSEELDSSELAPTPAFDAVEYEDRAYPIEQSWKRVDTVYEFTYQAELVAETDAAFLSYLRSTYRFDLDDVSDAEREVIEEAIDERYFESDPGDGFESLAERLHSRQGFNVDNHDGQWCVRYDGDEYWVYMRTSTVIDP